MNSIKVHCRLCAESKHSQKQLDLQSDNQKRNEIAKKLSRINAHTEFVDTKLPTTVCLDCIRFLNKCFDFVINIENAQKTLAEIVTECYSDNETCFEDADQEPSEGDCTENIVIDIKDEELEVPQNTARVISLLTDNETCFEDSDQEPSEGDCTENIAIDIKDEELEVPQNTARVISPSTSEKSKENKNNTSLDSIPLARLKQIWETCTENIANDIKVEELKVPQNTATVISTSEKSKENKMSTSLDSIPLARVKQTWEEYRWLCTFCQKKFKNIEELQIHSIAFHNSCNPYRCPECKIRKESLNKFLIHVLIHNKDFRYSCYKCFKKYRTICATKEHCKTHIDSELSCPGCNTTFKTKEEHKFHVDTYFVFKMKEKLIEIPSSCFDGQTCLICSKTFVSIQSLRYHYSRMHSEKRKDHMCEICGKSFYDKPTHRAHMLHVHTDYRPYKCPICKLGFKTVKSMKDHTGRHYNEKPLACDKCGKNFRLQRHLKEHSVMHTDQFQFQCRYCDKRFQRKQYLTNHLMQHTGERPYSCEPCQQRFTSWGNYNKHMVCRHKKDMARKKVVMVDKPRKKKKKYITSVFDKY